MWNKCFVGSPSYRITSCGQDRCLRYFESYRSFGSSFSVFLSGGVVVDRISCGQSWELGIVDSQKGLDFPENLSANAGSNTTTIGILSLKPATKH